MIWGTRLARNQAIFHDVFIPPKVYAWKFLAILSHFLQLDGTQKERRIVEEVMDKFG